ncbi:hypothetical protein KBTX_01973 [wastewater metagenome]|uniref:Glycosyltransferase 2-like domain-containing protein n=2 Tax=unclassified sequences TaxID=12908 RepID=A0A5B8RA61_9ZZZZ|nr:glycosyltransferase family 2 protein [Arhodomonas sp. KWT]QEA05650.1 hypothetical protein KBTEX_01973 [uncultured organism]
MNATLKNKTSVSQKTRTNSLWPEVGVVVLNWNNYEDSARCLSSLEAITYDSHSVYLVDNDSQDGSGKKLFDEFHDSGVQFVFNERNLGFAAGCNRGIKKALDDGCDYILLLNNDCIVYDKDFIRKSVMASESNKNIGIVGGKILFWPDTQRIWSTGGYIKFWGSEVHIGHGEKDKGQYDRAADRRFISGALMLIKREIFDHLGLLPEVYFFGKEEWEFSTRAARLGYRLLYHPNFSVYHEASNSHDSRDPTYVYNGTLSKILYKRRNLAKLQFWVWFAIYKLYVRHLFSFKYRLHKRRYLQGVRVNVLRQAMIEAVRDAPRTDKISEEMLIDFRNRMRDNDT